MVYDLTTATITTWLQFLRAVMPPSGILLVGAGIGTSPLVQLLKQWEEPNTILVEGEKSQYQHLKRNLQRFESWQIYNLVVAPIKESVTFYRASNKSESGLINPALLQVLWPNLFPTQILISQPSVTIAGLLDESKNTPNWLLIDCLPAGELLIGAIDSLAKVDLIVTRVLLYDNGTPIHGSDHEDITLWMHEQGFMCICEKPERHPALAHALYVRDLNHLKLHIAHQQKFLALALDKQTEHLQSLDEMKNHSALQQGVIQQLIEANDDLVQENASLVERQGKMLVDVATLEKILKKEITNSTKQLEAFLEVQNYLSSGEFTGEMHGWSISPDFARYLIEIIEINDYDLVIEFGSGTSTILIAKVLRKFAYRRQEKMPTEQIAFEHLEQFHAQTLNQLHKAGLDDSVHLALAPLQPYIALNGNTYQYYNCKSTMEALTSRYSSTGQRILVLVDGPPNTTGKHARYAALPIVLAYFDQANIDFLVDDYRRYDEKEIIQLWLEELQSAGRQAILTEKKLEKGACLISLFL